MNYLPIIADIVGVGGAVFALFAALQTRGLRAAYRREQKRQQRKITIVLRNGADQIVQLPVTLRRSELTRAEVMGRLGMIPMKEKGARFFIGHLNTLDFLQQLDQIIQSRGDATLVIPCTQDEIDQFAIRTS